MATLSTHNGSAVRQAHNKREKKCVEKEPHIREDGNYEILHHESLKDAYERIFGDAVARYNAKQTRADRQIKDYLEDVRSDDRRHDAYEMIIGVYGENVSDQDGYDIMREFVDTWSDRNPNLEMIGAYYHADEQGKNPHVHIDYVPVAHGYQRGMDTQNGLVKAFGEMGLHKSGRETAQIKWERRENAYLEDLCLERGLKIEHPQSGQENVKHMQTMEYKASMRAKEALLEKESAERSLDAVKSDISIANEQLERVLKLKAKASEIKKPIFMREKDTVTFHSNMREDLLSIGQEVRDALAKAQDMEDRATDRERDLNAREFIVELKEKGIEPLFKQAEDKLQEAEDMKEHLDDLVIEKAKGLIADHMLQEDDMSDRMAKFMSQYKVGDKSLDQIFHLELAKEIEDRQKALERSYRSRGRNRLYDDLEL